MLKLLHSSNIPESQVGIYNNNIENNNDNNYN